MPKRRKPPHSGRRKPTHPSDARELAKPRPLTADEKEILRLKKLNMQKQLELELRALQPLDIEFDPNTMATREGLINLQADILDASFARKISSFDFNAMNGAIRNLRELVCPNPSVIVNVANIAELKAAEAAIHQLPKEKQVVLAEALATVGSVTPSTGP